MPGPQIAAPRGRETVHRDDGGRHACLPGLRDGRIHCFVEGHIEAADALLLSGIVDPGIARHHGAVRQTHDQRRVLAPPVGIDDQA